MLLLDDDDDDDTHLSSRDKDAKRKMLTTVYRQDVEREVNRVKSILNSQINAASSKWKSAKVVRTREKVCECLTGVTCTVTSSDPTASLRVRRAHCRLYGIPARTRAGVDPRRVHDPGRVPPRHSSLHI